MKKILILISIVIIVTSCFKKTDEKYLLNQNDSVKVDSNKSNNIKNINEIKEPKWEKIEIPNRDLTSEEIIDFQTNTGRVQHRNALNEYLAAAISTRTADHLMADFKSFGVPAARIRDLKSVFEKPEAQAMILREITKEGIETKRMQTVAFQMC